MITTLPRRIALKYKLLYSVTSKLERTAASIGFIYQALYHEVTPTFAVVRGQLSNIQRKIA